jgi:hypothetical protein
MRRISLFALIIMIHSGHEVFSMSSVDFNKEIEMVSQDQYKEHLVTLNQTQVTEAAVDFENKFRSPSPTKSLAFFPMKLKPKPFMKPKTKVAELTQPPKPKLDLPQLYRQQVL